MFWVGIGSGVARTQNGRLGCGLSRWAPFERDDRLLAAVAGCLAADKGIDRVICLGRGMQVGSSLLGNTMVEASEVEARVVDLQKDLTEHMRRADAVLCLGWSGHGGRAAKRRWSSVVANVCRSVAAAEVTTFVYGSSAVAYAPAPSGGSVDEAWPTSGITSAAIAFEMAQSERVVDQFVRDHEIVRTVRLRHPLVVLPVEATGRWNRLVGGQLAAHLLAASIVPNVIDLNLQAIHVADLAEAYRLALTESVIGPYNVADEPINSEVLAAALGARALRVPGRSAAA